MTCEGVERPRISLAVATAPMVPEFKTTSCGLDAAAPVRRTITMAAYQASTDRVDGNAEPMWRAVRMRLAATEDDVRTSPQAAVDRRMSAGSNTVAG
jgi:hypothetical protein